VAPNLDIRMTSERYPLTVAPSVDRSTRIYERATSADYMICLITGRESGCPWILFELGLRLGAEKSQVEASSKEAQDTFILFLDDSRKSTGPLSLYAAVIADERALGQIVREVTKSPDDAKLAGAIAGFRAKLAELQPTLLDKQHALWMKLHDIDRVYRIMSQYAPSIRKPTPALAGDIDRQVSKKLNQCLEELADIIGVDTLLNRLDSVEKTVHFLADGTFEATTVYNNLVRAFPDRDEVTIHVPYRRRKNQTLTAPEPSDEFRFEVKVGDEEFRPVPEYAFGEALGSIGSPRRTSRRFEQISNTWVSTN
jgi:hypothetical protein